jgi:hypothetical protein
MLWAVAVLVVALISAPAAARTVRSGQGSPALHAAFNAVVITLVLHLFLLIVDWIRGRKDPLWK